MVGIVDIMFWLVVGFAIPKTQKYAQVNKQTVGEIKDVQNRQPVLYCLVLSTCKPHANVYLRTYTYMHILKSYSSVILTLPHITYFMI